MKHWYAAKLFCMLTTGIQILVPGSNAGSSPLTNTGIKNDTSNPVLQRLIDSTYFLISAYSDLRYMEDKLNNRLDSIRDNSQAMNKEIAKSENDAWQKIAGLKTQGLVPQSIKNEVRELFRNFFRMESPLASLKRDSLAIADSIKILENRVAATKQPVGKILSSIQQDLYNANGPAVIRIKNISYRIFIVQNPSYRIDVHVNKERGYTIQEYRSFLMKKKKDAVLMITNGGMFTDNYRPQGLLVSNNVQIGAVDTSSAEKSGNFYLYPNGIFHLDQDNKYHVTETRTYQELQKTKKIPVFATQSGPLIVRNGKIHPRFSIGSQNLNIRSGVGVAANDRVVFIASESPVSFYDFSMVFLYYFGCNDALYLDGAISKMYFAGDKNIPDMRFGPVISVTKKQL